MALPTITTILSGDLIKNSRVTINDNFSAINTASTESDSGLIELATLSETLAGIDDERAIVPINLKSYFDSRLSGSNNFGSVLPAITNTYNLGSQAK